MYDIPEDLDLSPLVGEFTTQLRVGQFDLQLTLGSVSFAIQSPLQLVRDGQVVGNWEQGRWPDPTFYDVMNTTVQRCDIYRVEQRIEIEFENGIAMHLDTRSDEYESMQISLEGDPGFWVI